MSTFPQFNKPGIDLFYDLVNKTNTTSFRVGDLILGLPAVGTHPEHSFVNTIIQVSGTDRVAFKGPQPLHYRRIDIGLLLSQENLSFSLPEGTTNFTTADVLPLVNARFQIRLEAADVLSGSWTADPDADQNIVLEITSSSLTYTNQVTLKILKAGDVPEPGDIVYQYDMNQTTKMAGSDNQPDPDPTELPYLDILKMERNHFLATATPPTQGMSIVPLTSGMFPANVSDEVSYALNGFVTSQELETIRRYEPFYDNFLADTCDLFYQYPDGQLTGIKITAEVTTSAEGSWGAMIQYGGQGKWRRWLSQEHTDQLGEQPVMDFSTPLPLGKSTVTYTGQVKDFLKYVGVGFVMFRMDNRALVPINCPIADGSVYVYKSGSDWIADLYGSSNVDGVLSTQAEGATYTVSQSPTNQAVWSMKTENAGATDFDFSPLQDRRPRLRITVTALSAPFTIKSSMDSDTAPDHQVTAVGQSFDLVEYYSPKIIAPASTGGEWSASFEVKQFVRDEAGSDVRETIDVKFTNLELLGLPANTELTKTSRKQRQLGAWSWQLPAHSKTIVGGVIDPVDTYTGISLISMDGQVYIERYYREGGGSPGDGDSSAEEAKLRQGWFPIQGNIVLPNGTEYTGQVSMKQAMGYVACSQSNGLRNARYAISLEDGILMEQTDMYNVGDANGYKWTYFAREAPTVVGHGKMFMYDTLAVQLVDTPIDDIFNFYYARTGWGQGEKWGRGVPLDGHAMPTDVTILSSGGADPRMAFHHETLHAGKFCLHIRPSDSLGSAIWYDLPVTVGRVKLFRCQRVNDYNDVGYLVCIGEEGDAYYISGRDIGTEEWKPLSNVVLGEAGLDDYLPLLIHDSADRLLSWVGGDPDVAMVHAVDMITYQGNEATVKVPIGAYDTYGDPLPRASQPQWSKRFLVQRMRNSGGQDTHFGLLYVSADQQQVLRASGNMFHDPAGPPIPI